MGVLYLGIAVGSPFQGRMSDRFGVRPLLILSSFLFVGIAVLVVGFQSQSLAYLFPLTFLLGASRPQGQGFGRSSWQVLYKNESDRLTAASLDSIQSASINGLAAMFAISLAQIIDPGAVLVGSVVVAAVAAVVLTGSKVTPLLAAKQQARRGSGGLFRSRDFRVLLLVQILFFVSDGFLVVALLTFSSSLEKEYLGGVFIFVFLIGALVGSYLFGKNSTEHLDHRKSIFELLPRYTVALSLLPLGLISPWFLIPILPIAGFSRRGFTPSVQTLTQQITPLKRINEALAIIYVGLVVGSGLGRALISPISDNRLYLLAPAILSFLALIAALFLVKRKNNELGILDHG